MPAAPGAAQDAADDLGRYVFSEAKLDDGGAGSVAGEGGPGTGSLVAFGEGGGGWHRRVLGEC
jgi:hypothetical protein